MAQLSILVLETYGNNNPVEILSSLTKTENDIHHITR